jgi:type I restriction enzyme S subunit
MMHWQLEMDENFDIPKSWVISKLEQVCEIYQGYGFPKEHQGKKDGKYPFYKVGDISKNVQKGNRYLENCDNYIDEEILSKLRAKLIPANSIFSQKSEKH